MKLPLMAVPMSEAVLWSSLFGPTFCEVEAGIEAAFVRAI